jgi:diacylglycerol kinase (ATP)
MKETSAPISFVVVNPNAGNGKGKKEWNTIKSILKKHSFQYKHVFTSRKMDASKLVKKAIANGYRTVVAVGGDGTLHEIINGIMEQNSAPTNEVFVGLIPVGSGNDWGKMFGIPTDYEEAIKVLIARKCYKHDIGLVSHNLNGVTMKSYFLNVAGTGFEAKVIKKSHDRKNRRGKSNSTTYITSLLSCLLSNKNQDVTITIDGTRIEQKIFSLNIGNGIYCGGGMRQAPNAKPNDGLLDVTVIGDITPIEVIFSLKYLYNGKIYDHKKVDGYRAKKVTVESAIPMYSEADGELLGETPLEFAIAPGAINAIINLEP